MCGELGAGKTTLTRGVLKALGHQDAVKSPTYTIVEPYESLAAGPLYHFDLYRLGDPEELEYLGLRDYLASGARLIFEWPERAGLRLPSPDMTIALEIHGATRVATISARGADLASELEGLRLSSLDSTIDP